MAGQWTRVLATGTLAALALGAAGCSDDGSSPSDVASKAASAVSSVGAEVTAAASSAAAQAQQKLDEVKNSVDAKGDVQLGDPATDGEGRTTVEVTADNKEDATKSFAVQVDFRDSGGNLLDTVVVTVPDVAAGKSGKATARSNRKLSGDVTTDIKTALRY
ncbi:hypothetical protein H9Y04_20245 [Streptomyces sp. TRM66268-LWL]|uniref:Lipoprotein n=1 Tax=Streptomyces polyasparticus TaxID=2767826 RepID=A0ABR7SJW8_9ACTN|nr:hypothetical protein [Streptomyces polyasparticus]MBC9714882.1 hypothetical protein [Streptomyces polyasparticus]